MDRVYAPPDALPQCLRRRAGEEADQKGGVMKEEKKEGREEGRKGADQKGGVRKKDEKAGP